jgi:hypothetical protein
MEGHIRLALYGRLAQQITKTILAKAGVSQTAQGEPPVINGENGADVAGDAGASGGQASGFTYQEASWQR